MSIRFRRQLQEQSHEIVRTARGGTPRSIDGVRRSSSIRESPGEGWKKVLFLGQHSDADPLAIPKSSVLGLGAIYDSFPGACHGDMHAGNVMLEVLKTMMLLRINEYILRHAIDFRSAGPGPRTIDAVTLEVSVRLADSDVQCRRLSPTGEVDLSTSERLTIAEELVGRLAEGQIVPLIFMAMATSLPLVETEAAEIFIGPKSCFKDLTLAEYLSTSIRDAVVSSGSVRCHRQSETASLAGRAV